ncbi:MAG: hypothetical protein EBU97_02175 [Rhodobacteraceae bacterium]|nr:hypothetical protein [Paracoccaceae bacterium]
MVGHRPGQPNRPIGAAPQFRYFYYEDHGFTEFARSFRDAVRSRPAFFCAPHHRAAIRAQAPGLRGRNLS